MSEYVNHLRYYKYVLPNGRNVFLTQRPDSVTIKREVLNFIIDNNIIQRFQYTDNEVDFGDVPYQWFLWVPGKNPSIESVYSSTIALKRFNEVYPPDRSLWLHCDSSSMRAPTYFGLFLAMIYPNEAQEICDKGIQSEEKDIRSKPSQYTQIAYDLQPELKELVEWYKKDPKFAYYYLMQYDMTIWGK